MLLQDFTPRPVMAGPDAGGPAGFTTNWHGHGAGHQAGNNAGQSADERHNFGADTAGKSGVNPTQGSAQDDFSSSESGLPMVPMKPVAFDDDEDLPADVLMDLFT